MGYDFISQNIAGDNNRICAAGIMNRFGCLRDRLFGVSLAAYAFNRLWIQRLTGLRQHDRPPSWPEMLSHFVLWSVMCKIIGPFHFHIGVADPWDVSFFAVGGSALCLWWSRPLTQSCPASS
jgi:hypothetical protein